MIIDVHHHWMPKEHIDNVEKYLRPGEVVTRENDKIHVFRDNVLLWDLAAIYGDVERQLQAMDAAHIDMAVLSLSLWQYWNTMAMAQFINDSMAEVQQRYGDRIIGVAHVPPLEEGAAEELERAVKILGLKGLCITTHSQGKYPDDDAYRPLYQKVAELDIPILVHAAPTPVEYGSLVKYNLATLFGRAIDHTLVVLRLLSSSMLDDFPSLKFINGHIGGTWFALQERFLHPSPRSSYAPKVNLEGRLRQLYFDTAPAWWARPEVVCAVANIGVDHLVFGSDFPASWPDSMERNARLIESLDISETAKQKIFSDNAAKLFRLKG